MLRKISPANGYCLFFPNRQEGSRFVSGRGVWVWPLEQWKHVKLGLFQVTLPAAEDLIVTTSEKLECDVKASFGIVVGTPPDDWKEREARLERATLTCPPTRSLAPEHRVELVPFFRDWAANHCRMALLNAVGQAEYVRLFEDAKYRAEVQKKVEDVAGATLLSVGMLLVHCAVVITPREPSGPHATPEILDKWRTYTEAVHAEEEKKRESDLHHQEKMKNLEVTHAKYIAKVTEQEKRDQAEMRQETDFKLRDLAFDVTKKEAALAIEEKREGDKKDREIGRILEEMAKRAQDIQLLRIKREAELQQERLARDAELEKQRSEAEQQQLVRRGRLIDEQQTLTQKEVALLPLTTQLKSAELDYEAKRGATTATNVELEVLAKGAQERHMQADVLSVLPKIVEHVAAPTAKIGNISVLGIPSGHPTDTAPQGIGSILASATVLPIVREVLGFMNNVTHKFHAEGARSDQFEP